MPDFIFNFTYEKPTLGVILFALIWSLACSGLIFLFFQRKKGTSKNLVRILFVIVSLVIMAVMSIIGISALFATKKVIIYAILALICNFTLPIIVFNLCSNKSRAEDLARLNNNPVVNKIVSSANETNATAIYCCKDGVRIVHSQFPPCTNISNPGWVTCESLKVFEDTCENFSQISQFSAPVEHRIDFLFSEYNYPPLTDLTLFDLADTIAGKLKNYVVKPHRHYIQFTEKARYESSGSYHAYSVNGTTTITEGSTKTPAKRHSKVIDYYAAIIRTDMLPAEKAATKTEQKTMNQW